MKWQIYLVIGLDRLAALLVGGPNARRDSLSGNGSDPESDHDRGDVPGWVMITVMTAIVVIGLLVVFEDAVTNAVRKAFQDVNDAGN